MAGLKIDLDRGILYELPVEKRPRGGVTHKKDPETGAEVFMYKTHPGVFYSANGVQVSETMAKRAGFDVDRLRKEKDKIEKMAEFEAKYNEQLRSETRQVVVKRGDFRLVILPDERYIVENEEGEIMTKGVSAASLQQGMDWLADFAGPEVENVNVRTADNPSEVGADRRPAADGRLGGDLGKSGRPKVAIPA